MRRPSSPAFLFLTVLLAAACGQGTTKGGGDGVEPPAGDVEHPVLDVVALDEHRFVVATDALLQLSVDLMSGVLVAEKVDAGYRLKGVTDGSPAAQLGLVEGDVVTAINGVALTGPQALREAHAALRARGEATATVTRGGETVELAYITRESIAHLLPPARDADVEPDAELEEILALLADGVTRTGPTDFEVDRAVLEVVAEHGELLAAARVRRAPRGRVGVHVGAGPSVYRLLGITEYDVVKAVGARDIVNARDLREALAGQAEELEMTISILRLRDPMILRYKVVSGRVDADKLAAAVAPWAEKHADLLEPPTPPRRGGSGGPPPDLSGIRKVDDTTYRIERATVDKVLANPMSVARGARIVPSIKDGKPNGFKLYAIRPSSIYSALGLNNGDTVHTINGYDLTTPDKALEVYQRVKEADTLVLDITRRGKPVRLTWEIE